MSGPAAPEPADEQMILRDEGFVEKSAAMKIVYDAALEAFGGSSLYPDEAGMIERAVDSAFANVLNVLPELVNRTQWAIHQIQGALQDTRLVQEPVGSAWLRTVRDGLSGALDLEE